MSTATRLTGTRLADARLTGTASARQLKRLASECPIMPATLPSDLPDGEHERIRRRNEAIVENIGLAFNVIREYGSSTNLDMDERRGEAFLSFVRAADRHDPAKGKLSTVATLDGQYRFMRIRDTEIKRIRQRARYAETRDLTPIEPPDRAVADADELALLRERMKTLPDRDRRIIELRFGLNGGEPMTLQVLARAIGVSYQRIQQLQRVAMTRLREAMTASEGAA